MKVWFVYKLTNQVNGRQYIGIHSSRDITWASPAMTLTQLTGYDPILTSNIVSARLLTDIEQHGNHRFMIEALQAAPTRAEANRARRRILQAARSQNLPLYNSTLGGDPYRMARETGSYQPNITNNAGRRFRKRISATLKRIHREHPRQRDASGRFVRGWTYQKVASTPGP
jgi:hypothetical protein